MRRVTDGLPAGGVATVGSSASPQPLIHFNQPYAVGTEFEYIRQAIANAHTCGDGPFTKQCCSILEESLGVPRALLTTSCTHALEMAALLLDLEPGRRGHRAVVHVRLDGQRVRAARRAAGLRRHPARHAQPRRDAAGRARHAAHARPSSPVHYAGVGCEMDAILAIAERHGVAVVEDNAHGSVRQVPRPARSARSARSRRRAFTRRRTSPAARAARCSSTMPAVRRARRDPAREGHQPQPVLPRPGRQVHLGRRRLELSAVRHAGGVPARRSSRRATRSRRRARRIWECYDASLADWASGERRPPADRSRRTASRRITCSTC